MFALSFQASSWIVAVELSAVQPALQKWNASRHAVMQVVLNVPKRKSVLLLIARQLFLVQGVDSHASHESHRNSVCIEG